ncbi:MAG: hypothetical protein AYK18_06810 [Theionarchaea archaeon DG-70]|nr:MAG: hypothetical protein AYK18_06810 [Theionarchaea archaeon DG-70]
MSHFQIFLRKERTEDKRQSCYNASIKEFASNEPFFSDAQCQKREQAHHCRCRNWNLGRGADETFLKRETESSSGDVMGMTLIDFSLPHVNWEKSLVI